jgi:hypothetical protein
MGPKVKVKYIRCDNSEEICDIQNYLREKTPEMRCKFELQHQIHYNRMVKLKGSLLPYMEE